MGKRTSDFVALAAIVGGAGLGFGLTSLFAGAAPVAQPDDASVEIRIVRDAHESSVEAQVLHYSVILTGEQGYGPGRITVGHAPIIPSFRYRILTRGAGDQLQQRRAEAEGLRRGGQEMLEIRGLYEALKEVEVLEGLNLGQYLTDILRSDEDGDDQRKRRRRRRPRQEAEARDSDASRNR